MFLKKEPLKQKREGLLLIYVNVFSWGKSLANNFARNARHSRIKKLQPLFQKWEHIERNLSPEEKKIEKAFFRNTALAGIMLFLFFTAVPYLQRFDQSFWPLVPVGFTPILSESFSMADDGFFAKSSIPTQKGDRSDINKAFHYTVKSGDSLSSIAYKFDIRVRTILDNNEIINPNRLKTGTILKILPVDGIEYEVKKGDTLDNIAKKYKVKTEDIKRQNRLSSDNIASGDTLLVPGGKRKKSIVVIAPPKTSTSRQNSRVSIPPPKASSPASRPKKLIFPTKGKITQYYHYGHYAIDIANRSKPDIVAAAGGTIVKASYGWNSGYGNVIIIDHGGGMQTLYGHHETLYVQEGQQVRAGQSIGKMGNTGRVYGVTGIHVHFEVRVNGAKKNPMGYF